MRGKTVQYFMLRAEMHKRGGKLKAAQKIVRERYIDGHPSVWFVPNGSRVMDQKKAAKKILTWYQKNMVRFFGTRGKARPRQGWYGLFSKLPWPPRHPGEQYSFPRNLSYKAGDQR